MSRKYFWIIARDETGKTYLIAGANTEEETRSKGLEMLGGVDFEIRALPTRNIASASRMVRGKRLEETQSLRKAKERLGHNRSLNRLRRKRRNTIYE